MEVDKQWIGHAPFGHAPFRFAYKHIQSFSSFIHSVPSNLFPILIFASKMVKGRKTRSLIDASSKVPIMEEENTMWPTEVEPSQKRKVNEDLEIEPSAKKPKPEYLWKLVKHKFVLIFRLCDGNMKSYYYLIISA